MAELVKGEASLRVRKGGEKMGVVYMFYSMSERSIRILDKKLGEVLRTGNSWSPNSTLLNVRKEIRYQAS